MARIHTLAPEEAHKIAAGEVVERPASVVKELMENALDADADHIALDIHDGGRQRIRITDNGHGMDADDMHACIQQHTTSKITRCDDVASVGSFGFRGEALASICHISTLTITSRETDAEAGYTITVSEGHITHEQVASRAPGTEIIVDDIFANVPARKKFLKKRETEWRAIYQQCLAFAAAYPSCAFTIYHDGKTILQCSRTENHQERVAQIHDRFFARQCIRCEYTDETHGISVHGVITQPEYHRYDRSLLTCFVNHRWVKNHRLGQAIIKGYADILPHRRFPAGYIFIHVPYNEVDINVHPRKEEVQFMHPRRVERAIEQAVRTALEEHTREHLYTTSSYTGSQAAPTASRTSAPSGPIPQHHIPHNRTSAGQPQQFASHHVVGTTDASENHQNTHSEAVQSTTKSQLHQEHNAAEAPTNPVYAEEDQRDHTTSQPTQQSTVASYADEKAPDHEQQTESSYSIVGQIHQSYIIVANADGMSIIDQHAAHERVLYEAFMATTDIATTKLMFPYRISLRQDDCDHLMDHASLLQTYGITIDRFDTSHIVITSAPVALNTINWSDMLHKLATVLPRGQQAEQAGTHLYHDLCATLACKAAIKAGDQLSHAEMHEIIRKMYACPRPMTCPHGRPTIITFSCDELERKFKRSG